VLLDPAGSLPRFATEGDQDEAAIVAVDRLLREEWRFPVPVLETHPQWHGVPEGEPIPVLIMTERAPDSWTPPVGLVFGPLPGNGGLFLKAVFPPFHAEPILTQLLAGRFPSHLPTVLAIEPDEGWLVVGDIAATLISELPKGDRANALAIGARPLVEIQSVLAGRPGDLAILSAA